MAHFQPQMDLISTKLHPPPVRENRVTRRHLLDMLDNAVKEKLTLICAPAGYGKTTLLSQWLSRHPKPVGWVSLDHTDNDLAQFLRYLLAAIQNVDSDVGAGITAMLQPHQSLSGPAIWAALINDLENSEKEFVLILDDYQEVEAKAVHNALGYLIEHMPDNLHLILATRADPPLSLPRLRARGHLIELRQIDLRFSTEEISEFLNNIMGLDLWATDIAALEDRTEGWIAALQMAALSLQGHSPERTSRSEFVQAFTGSHRFILDYLVEEVLDQQPPGLQEFLLKTSILERVSGSLCDAILGEQGIDRLADRIKPQADEFPTTDSQSILEHLDAANLFIIPLDDEREWYRYHHLFSDLLRKRLVQTFPDLVLGLHRRASTWHEQQGHMATAIDHAISAKDFERAAILIEDNLETTLMRSEVMTFLKWIERLPDEWVRSRSTLCFFHAWALLMSGSSLAVVEQRLKEVTCIQDTPQSTLITASRVAALRAYLMLFQADIQSAVELCHQALEHLPESDLFLHGMVAWILSMERLEVGTLQEGKETLNELAKMGLEINNPLLVVTALCHQARLQMRQGRLQRARKILERALDLAIDSDGQQLPIASEALIWLGELEREWNHLEVSANYLVKGIELSKEWSDLAGFDAYFPLARVKLAQGDVDGAREVIETAWQTAHKSDSTELDDLLADLQQAYFFTMTGDIEGTMRWVEKRGLTANLSPVTPNDLDPSQKYVNTHLRKYEQLVLARALILQGRTAEALKLLEALLTLAKQLDRTDLTIEVQILRAMAFQLQGHEAQALEAFSEALSFGERGGYVRIFIDEGEPVVQLLDRAGEHGIAPDYVANLLATFRRGESSDGLTQVTRFHAPPPIENLSDRELMVLRLLATGMSNPEIADELVIAASTVRSHCKSIYRKLNVHKRWEAVRQAQELGLI